MGLSSIIALKATLAFVALLCLREARVQETKDKRILGWVLGTLFLIGGVFAFTDVNAHESHSEARMCVHYTLTQETRCMAATTVEGCTTTVAWFEKEASWHKKNRYCCVGPNEDPNMCLPRTELQKRIDALMEHAE